MTEWRVGMSKDFIWSAFKTSWDKLFTKEMQHSLGFALQGVGKSGGLTVRVGLKQQVSRDIMWVALSGENVLILGPVLNRQEQQVVWPLN